MVNLSKGSQEFSLTICLKKIHKRGQGNEQHPGIKINNYNRELVHEFIYLGSTVSVTHSLDTNVNRQIQEYATTVARQTSRVWKNNKLPTKTKWACVGSVPARLWATPPERRVSQRFSSSLYVMHSGPQLFWPCHLCQIYHTYQVTQPILPSPTAPALFAWKPTLYARCEFSEDLSVRGTGKMAWGRPHILLCYQRTHGLANK